MVEKTKSRKEEVVTQEYTINLQVPPWRVVKEIRKFAMKAMGMNDMRVDVNLNKFVWSQGIRSVPRRIRVSHMLF
ncbi:hypothetical protein VNO78_18997 [Psophocarpus tetragonolobus]|uniref:60S ribosomal protein L31 n=1 Tax=Psophocarpus tetragonolobus TaxID=3891 RepID=A0AAN9S7Q5_PSOTE